VADIAGSIRRFLEDLSTDELEERVLEYVVREVGNGRRLEEVLKDPYVRNRMNEDQLDHVLEDPEVVDAIEKNIRQAFEQKDFGFTD
jgi:hypothetical protein